MPTAPLRRCTYPGCPALGPCPTHARPAWYHSTPVQRIRGRRLQRLRARLFDTQPLCVACQAEGRTTIATIRDHVLTLEAGGTDTEDNVQPLCAEHHDLKTQRESARGRR